MSARPRNRRAQDEAGVSNVLGAILVFALLVLFLAVMRSEFVPVWEEDREARHADQVANQIGFLKAELDRAATNGTTSPVTSPIDLGTEGGFRFFQGSNLPGEMRFLPDGGDGMRLETPSLTIQSSGGTSLLGLEEEWQSIQDGVEIGPIDRVQHLRVRVPNPNALASGLTSTLTLTDSSGAYAGKIVMRNGDDAVYLSTYDADSPTVPITNRLDDTDPDGPTFYFNLLDSNLLFTAVLEATSRPYRLVLDEGGLPADYTIVYDRVTPTGIERVGSDIGLTTVDYGFSAPAGRLEIETRNDEFPAQTYVIEHGAVILVQHDGATMVIPPGFTASSGPTQDRIEWTIPTLDGDANALRAKQASVTFDVAGRFGVTAFAPSFSLTLPTAYPAVWEAFWEEKLAAAGFDAGAGEYAITLTGSSASLTVYGPVASPGSTTNDILMTLRQATVRTDLFPSG